VPAIIKAFEPHQMRRQGGRDIRLALDWVNGIVLAIVLATEPGPP